VLSNFVFVSRDEVPQLLSDELPESRPSDWWSSSEHPLKLERYRED